MQIDPDDLPEGFAGESQWTKVENVLYLYSRPGGRAQQRGSFTGLTGGLDDELRDSGKTATQIFYARHKKDPVWVAKKNEYKRMKYKEKKNTTAKV